jgi:hypothetical protein
MIYYAAHILLVKNATQTSQWLLGTSLIVGDGIATHYLTYVVLIILRILALTLLSKFFFFLSCTTSRHRAMAASVALAHGIERPRGDTGDTNTTNSSLHTLHLSDEMRMERHPIRRPLSGDIFDLHQRRDHPDTNRRSFDNRSAYDRPTQRQTHTSSRSTPYFNSNRDDRDQRGE